MTDRTKPDLRSIEPIGRAPDAVDEDVAEQNADRVGRVAAVTSNSGLAVGVEADADARQRGDEPTTSPESDEQLDRLRR